MYTRTKGGKRISRDETSLVFSLRGSSGLPPDESERVAQTAASHSRALCRGSNWCRWERRRVHSDSDNTRGTVNLHEGGRGEESEGEKESTGPLRF
jgi:hypothetical protein